MWKMAEKMKWTFAEKDRIESCPRLEAYTIWMKRQWYAEGHVRLEQDKLYLNLERCYQTAMSSILFSDVGLHVVPLSLTNTTLLSIYICIFPQRYICFPSRYLLGKGMNTMPLSSQRFCISSLKPCGIWLAVRTASASICNGMLEINQQSMTTAWSYPSLYVAAFGEQCTREMGFTWQSSKWCNRSG